MWNLCSNSINHSSMDPSTIKIDIQGRIDDNVNQPYIDILDNGPGIDEALLANIFEPYKTSKIKGSGLGLAIVKRIVEEHGGRVIAKNNKSGGARINVYLPIN